MTNLNPSRLTTAALWMGAGVGLGCAVRFWAIEPEAIGQVCTALAAPPWCLVRQAVVVFFHLNVIGLVAVAGGLLAVVGPRRAGGRIWAERLRARPLALAMGGLALILYNAGLGAVAVVLGLLATADET